MKNQKHFLPPSGDRILTSRLTVIRELLPSERKRVRIVECRCDCGNITYPSIPDVMTGKIESCGCLHSENMKEKFTTHGDSRSRLYQTYRDMLNRCYNTEVKNYRLYGAVGITVCDEWRNSYVNFKQWASSAGYEDHLTLERKKNYLNYNPENCEWIPNKLEELRDNETVQSWNLSTTNVVTIDDTKYPSIAEAERQTGTSKYKIKKYCDDPMIKNYSRQLRYSN